MSDFNSYSLLKFLHQSLNVGDFSQYSQYAYHEGEKIKQTSVVHMNLGGGILPAPAPLSFKMILAFSVFDAFIDDSCSGFEGLNFNEKYEKLPASTDLEKIKKFTYRISRFIRNKTIHTPSKVDALGDNLSINDKKYNSNITISKQSLDALIELILIFIEYADVNDKYFELIVRSYYRDIRCGISEFSDGNGDPFPEILMENKYFHHASRFLFYIANAQLDSNNCIYIKRHANDYKVQFPGVESPPIQIIDSDDYLIKTIDGNLFLVPGFKITDGGVVENATLHEWRIDGNWFGRKVILSQVENII